MNNITQRFLKVYEHLLNTSLINNQTSFAKEIKVSNSTITEICKMRTNAGITPIKNLVKRYPEINSNWILTGDGIMLNNINKILKEPGDEYKTDRLIPLYSKTASVLELFNNTPKITPIDYIKIPTPPRCDGAISITGDGMHPVLKNGDIVLYREIKDKSNIIWGEIYLIYINNEGDQFFFNKYIHKSKRKGYIKLTSENKLHEPLEFPIDSVVKLAIIKASINIKSSI